MEILCPRCGIPTRYKHLMEDPNNTHHVIECIGCSTEFKIYIVPPNEEVQHA